MENHEFNTIQVADGHGNGTLCRLYGRAGRFPAIIVLQKGFGLTQHIHNVVERL